MLELSHHCRAVAAAALLAALGWLAARIVFFTGSGNVFKLRKICERALIL